MNFLAHAHLSGENDDLLFGNFIADAVKGNGMLNYDGDVRLGIRLHRRIDTFTDKHDIVRKSVGRVRNSFGKYSGIVIDIFYDHFLAVAWSDFHKETLPFFAKRVYQILLNRYQILPDRTKRMLPYLIGQDWLVGYSNFEGLTQVFYGMDRRTDFQSGMRTAVDDLRKNYNELQSDFSMFYPELQNHVDFLIKEYLFLD